MLANLVKQHNVQDACTAKSSVPAACKLATTWRQVKRIMMSAYVIVFAYWHGEMMHEEASRYIAMARLLLEYPRWRWGEKLDEALQTLADISRLSDFKIYDHTQALLPGADEQFLRRAEGLHLVSAELFTATSISTINQTQAHDDTLPELLPWHGLFDIVPVDTAFGLDTNVLQNQALFGLWETIDCTIEEGPQTGSLHCH